MPLLAINDALYDTPGARDLQDVLTCIREGVTIETAGRRLEANAERHLKPPEEMARLFRDAPEAHRRDAAASWHAIDFSLDELTYEYPDEPVPPGWSAQGWLEELTWRARRNPLSRRRPGQGRKRCSHEELALIAKLDYARYFLTIHDIVRVAENKGILCQGRGSAANSAVCYALGITAVDPDRASTSCSPASSRPSGASRPTSTSISSTSGARRSSSTSTSATAATAPASPPPSSATGRAAPSARSARRSASPRTSPPASPRPHGAAGAASIADEHIRQAGLDPDNPTIRRAVRLRPALLGFPRHLSQHVGGFVLTRGRLDETVPIGNAAMEDRTFIEWDKDDIDALGLMKVDVLALGMLTCIRKAFDLLRAA